MTSDPEDYDLPKGLLESPSLRDTIDRYPEPLSGPNEATIYDFLIQLDSPILHDLDTDMEMVTSLSGGAISIEDTPETQFNPEEEPLRFIDIDPLELSACKPGSNVRHLPEAETGHDKDEGDIDEGGSRLKANSKPKRSKRAKAQFEEERTERKRLQNKVCSANLRVRKRGEKRALEEEVCRLEHEKERLSGIIVHLEQQVKCAKHRLKVNFPQYIVH